MPSQTHARKSTGLALLIAATLAACPAGTSRAQQVDSSFQRPAFSPVLRQNENWSALADHDPSQTGDAFDPIKYVPLSADGAVWAGFGGQVRQRFESWNNFGFGAGNDDNFLLTRLRLHADLHVGDHLRFFAETKSALSTDRALPGGNRLLERDAVDMQQ